MEFEWDEQKAAANLKRHSVDFADAALVLYDDLALTTQDPGEYDEERFATVAWTLSAAPSSWCTPGEVSESG